MYLIPLSQRESVELLIHALRMAGGKADCSSCPAAHVCMKQCLAIGEAIDRMFASGTLPGASSAGETGKSQDEKGATEKKDSKSAKKPGLKVIK